MVRFLDLPEELILGVIAFIPPEDLEDFAQTCSRVRSVAGSALEKHRLLTRQYSTMKNEEFRTIAKTLKAVLINPEIGQYIRDVSLNYIGGDQRNLNPKYSPEDLELFVAAITKSEFLSPRGQSPLAAYNSIIERGNEDILLAILLPLLPNLRSLTLPRVSNDGTYCWTSIMFSYLPHISAQTLTKLSTICINVSGVYFHLNEAKAYANLPSAKSLTASRLFCEGGSHASLFATPSSNITNLELWECRVSSKPLHDFLLGFHSLQTFAYSCDLPERLANNFDAFMIRSALLAKAKNTLRRLTVFACSRQSSAMGTLRPFEVLDEVSTDWGLLLSDRCSPTSRLAMSLPNSLRKLCLNDERGLTLWDYNDFLDNVVRAQQRGTQIQPQPHEDLARFEWGLQLRELTILSRSGRISYPMGMDDEKDAQRSDKWHRDCEKVGISLNYIVDETEKSVRNLRRQLKQTKRISHFRNKDRITGDKENGNGEDRMSTRDSEDGDDIDNKKNIKSSEGNEVNEDGEGNHDNNCSKGSGGSD